jgi:hypothetical protein
MWMATVFSIAILVLSELSLVSAKAILHMPRGISNLDIDMQRVAFDVVERSIERRAPQSSGSLVPSSSGDMNETISSACVDTLSQISTISNQAGILACYNILQSNTDLGIFQADLRLYQMQQPSGPFAGVPSGQMLVNLIYPSSTSFNVLIKRSLTKRQASMSELQQYSLQGTFTKALELSKLNETELMALMVPAISISAVEPGTQTPITTNVTITDTAFFLVGKFKNQFSSAMTDPIFQAAAIAQSSAFVMPGMTLGIFPTGLIVTGAWMLLFIIAFGVGTIGRIQHRAAYRNRKAAMGGRTGKRI